MPSGDFTHSWYRHPSTNHTSTLFSSLCKGHTILWHWVVLAEIARCGHKKIPIPRLLLLTMQKASAARNWRTWAVLWSELPPCFFALLSSAISNNLYTLPLTTKNRRSHSAPISSIYSEGYRSHFEPYNIFKKRKTPLFLQEICSAWHISSLYFPPLSFYLFAALVVCMRLVCLSPSIILLRE